MRLLIKNGYVCDGEHKPVLKDIYIEGGIVNKIDDHIDVPMVETIDAHENYVLPGLVDMNCSICDPGYEYREDIVSVSKSATKGGFTSITCLPDTKPVIDNKTVVNYIINKSQRMAKVNIYPYGSMTKGCEGKELSEIGEMIKAGIVGISDGNSTITDSSLMRNILVYSKMFNIPVITICEDKQLAGDGVMNRGRMSTQTGLTGIPREAEEIIVSRNLLLAQHNNARLHITHVSTEGSVNLIRRAKADGVNVTCETCPHYFTLSENDVGNYNTFAKVTPPLRTFKDIEGIKQGLVDGTIDVISSGHQPTSVEGKKLEFDRATYGISSLETAFSLSYTALVDSKIMSLNQLILKMSTKPTQILGLDGKGQLKEGADADILIFDKDKKYVIDASEFSSKAKYSPHDGKEVMGKVVLTVVNGYVVYLQ